MKQSRVHVYETGGRGVNPPLPTQRPPTLAESRRVPSRKIMSWRLAEKSRFKVRDQNTSYCLLATHFAHAMYFSSRAPSPTFLTLMRQKPSISDSDNHSMRRRFIEKASIGQHFRIPICLYARHPHRVHPHSANIRGKSSRPHFIVLACSIKGAVGGLVHRLRYAL